MTLGAGLGVSTGDKASIHPGLGAEAFPACAGLGSCPTTGVEFQSPWPTALASAEWKTCMLTNLWGEGNIFRNTGGANFEVPDLPAIPPVPWYNTPATFLHLPQLAPCATDSHESLQACADRNHNHRMQLEQQRRSLRSRQPVHGTSLSSIPEEREDRFSFTILKADGFPLGISFADEADDEQGLIVEAVQLDSAIDAWNGSCITADNIRKRVEAGDRIVSVNGISCQRALMLQECEGKALLKMVLVRRVAAQLPQSGKQVVELDRFLNAGSSGPLFKTLLR